MERDAAVDLTQFHVVSLLLQNADFNTAREIADAVNREFGRAVASAIDSRRIDVNVAASGVTSVPVLIARVQNLSVAVHPRAKVVVNERTGTIVIGGDVKLSPVSIMHGSLTVDIETTPLVSQPAPFSSGQTKVVNQTAVAASEAPAQSIQLGAGASVDELIRGLHTIGATSRDIIGILEAIKAAGGLNAELEVI